VRLDCGVCTVRSWRLTDLGPLVRYADNHRVWCQLRDRFPHPYTRIDGEAWLRHASQDRPETNFAIAVGEEAVGGIGLMLQSDVERVSAEIGYWIGEPFWGRGITTAAVDAFSSHAFEAYYLTRLYALPFARNMASRRVLEKAGFVLEAILRSSAIKEGELLDQALYARWKS
jgi:RimJ/RimL family protein N-acetyltransferase